jgi:hypothetical protein
MHTRRPADERATGWAFACRAVSSASAAQHTSTATLSAENASDKLPPDSDLPQRLRMTSPPGVRIQEVTDQQRPGSDHQA